MRKLTLIASLCAALITTSCSNDKKSETPEAAPEATEQTVTEQAAPDEAISNTIMITGNDQMKYSMTAFTVKAGEPITLTIKNVGKLPAETMSHDIVVLKPGSDYKAFGAAATQAKELDKMTAAEQGEMIAHSKMLGPGEEQTITFTLPAPGEYPFLCTFPGHYINMHGTFTAK